VQNTSDLRRRSLHRRHQREQLVTQVAADWLKNVLSAPEPAAIQKRNILSLHAPGRSLISAPVRVYHLHKNCKLQDLWTITDVSTTNDAIWADEQDGQKVTTKRNKVKIDGLVAPQHHIGSCQSTATSQDYKARLVRFPCKYSAI